MHEAPLNREVLLASYFNSGKPRDSWLVGAEFERHLLLSDGSPLPYHGQPGIHWLMDHFTREGWVEKREGEYPIALLRGKSSITLEPGGQFELSGAPFRSVGEVIDEATTFAKDIARHLDGARLDGRSIRQVALGFTPFAAIPDIGWVPKGRYVVMREHLAQTGPLAHHMMKGTAAVQATYDYADEADCARKVQLATLLGPLTTAIFANSPYEKGRATDYISWRGHIWTKTDPARTGFPESASRFTFERWVDYLLAVPMMFRKDHEGRWVAAHGQTFAAWMASETPPDMSDWDLHLTSVFPEVRTKHTIEVRGADCVPIPLAAGFVALWKGLFYDDAAMSSATETALRFAREGLARDRFEVACRQGLAGQIGGRTLAAWAEEILDAARAGLERIAPGDVRWLGALSRQVQSGRSPGQTLLERLGPNPTPEALIAATPMLGAEEQGA